MRIVGIGDNVVDRYVNLGQMFPGGNALNVAVFAHRAGAQSAYIGAVGTDRAGRLILRALQEEGVDVSHVRVVEGPTAYADVVNVDGDRQFVGASVGVSLFEPDAADLAFLRTCELVHSSIYSGLDSWIGAVGGQLPISFDFSDRIDPAYVRALAPQVVYALFSGSDTLGAGDAFLATFLVTHLQGIMPPEALDRAAEAAAAVCTYYGAFGRGGPIDGDRTRESPV